MLITTAAGWESAWYFNFLSGMVLPKAVTLVTKKGLSMSGEVWGY
jgi:hypothetical protein